MNYQPLPYISRLFLLLDPQRPPHLPPAHAHARTTRSP